MKKIIINTISIFILLLMVNCSKDDFTFGSLQAPTNLQVGVELIGKTAANPNGDGSGKVKFTATADDAISYKFVFPDGTSSNAPSGILDKLFTKVGLNSYTVIVIASGTGGVSTNSTVEVKVQSNFEDAEAVKLLTGGTTKKWYISASEPAHLGVGQNDGDATKNYFPNFYDAKPFEKATTCFYDNVLTFSLDGDVLKYKLDNGGSTFFHNSYLSEFGGTGSVDACLSYNTGGLKTVALSPSESVVMSNPDRLTQTRGTVMNFSDGGFMGYYVGQSSYEILSITDNRMAVRFVQANNTRNAWYMIFTTTKPVQTVAVDYTTLKFSDEFDTDGAPDPTKWSYDLGAGGWGNDEKQTYTNAADNIIVSGGSLKITAKKVGTGYTSSRLNSQDKYEFKYGKIEVRAKLPSGGGTWPAIWMLGADIDTNAWPACGEIDIMEYKGNEPYSVYGTFHYPGRSGGNADGNKVPISNAATEFHVYKAIWSPTSIQILVDDTVVHSIVNNNTIPFNKDFFLLFNVAMGGSFGGVIDPAFTQSSLEIDYVRVYQ
jgi:hypothetical protein